MVLGHCCVLVPGQPQSAFGLQYAIVQYIVQGASHSQLSAGATRFSPSTFALAEPSNQMCARREASGALHLPCCLTPSTRRTTPAIASTARQGTTHQHAHASLSMHSPTCCLTLHAVQTHIHPALYHMHITSPSALFRRTLRTHYVSYSPPHAHTSPQHSRRCPALIVCCCVSQDKKTILLTARL